jgi:hypothetical protein
MAQTLFTIPVPPVTPPVVTPSVIQPPAVTPPALGVSFIDSTSKGINVAQAGTQFTITDSGVVPPPGYKFPVGTTVTIIGNSALRNAPNADGSAGSQIGTVTAGQVGTVKGPPIKSNNTFNWLQVAFATSTGYIGDDNITAGGVNPQTPQS